MRSKVPVASAVTPMPAEPVTWQTLRSALRSKLFLRDAAFALVAAVLATSAAAQTQFAPDIRGNSTQAAIWAFLICVPLAWRRVAPAHSALIVAAVAVASLIGGYPLLIPADAAVLVALYSVAAYGPKWASRLALLVSVVGAVAMGLTIAGVSRGSIIAGTLVFDFAVLAVLAATLAFSAWALGLMRRARGETVAALRARAAALEDRARQLEFERDQQRVIATQAERARIAREMHDIVAHSLSIMIVQADGGRYMAAANPTAAGEVLGTISETGRQALKEMRKLLGVLRSEEAGETGPELAPLPGNSAATASGIFPEGLEELFTQARSAGMPLKVSTSGQAQPLDSSAALTLQRVCQEALTNVRKHAGPDAKVNLNLVWLPNEVQLTISDNGHGSANGISDPGYGLIGLGERATLVGGTLTSGPKPNGGWETKFTMPISGG